MSSSSLSTKQSIRIQPGLNQTNQTLQQTQLAPRKAHIYQVLAKSCPSSSARSFAQQEGFAGCRDAFYSTQSRVKQDLRCIPDLQMCIWNICLLQPPSFIVKALSYRTRQNVKQAPAKPMQAQIRCLYRTEIRIYADNHNLHLDFWHQL